VLVPVDGSDESLRAVDHVLDLVRRGLHVEVHLLNVQLAVRGAAASFVSATDLQDYHREEGMKALAGAIERTTAAGVSASEHIGVGDPGPTVCGFSRKLEAGHIVMGTHGRGGVANILMGSVAQHVVSHAAVPVTLVR
jgi:nucleotide-binding universal stress UspA family protein